MYSPVASATPPLSGNTPRGGLGLRRFLSLTLCAAGVLWSQESHAQAATLNVPGSYPTLQAALTASVPGDTILVAPGTYSGPGNYDLNLTNKSVTIQSTGGAASTVIDCQGSSGALRRAFVLTANSGNSTVQGFTIRNGYTSNGGAVHSSGGGTGTTSFIECIIRDNFTTGSGGAFFINGSNFNIYRCDFINNRCSQYGGALGIEQSQSGSYLVNVHSSVFRSNSAGSDGGAIDSAATSTLTANFVNSTFYGNTASASNTNSGTISFYNSYTTLRNCIVWGSSPNKNISSYNAPNARATFAYNDINQDLSSVAGTKTNNINVDPKFADAANGNLRLLSGSPCYGTGTSTGAADVDRDGAAWSGGVSMGAYAGLAGVPSAVEVSAPTSIDQGTAFNFTVTVKDAQNNVATNYSGVLHFTSSDTAAVLPADATVTNGVGTFSATLNTPGSQTISATDTGNATLTAQASITVNSVNANPVATDDPYNTPEDSPLNVAVAQGVLSNDTDANGQALTVELLSAPGNGTLTLNTDGSFDYTPNANYNGSDSFTYTVKDGAGGSDTGTVNLTVNAVNDVPSVTINLLPAVPHTNSTLDINANSVDVDGDTVQLTCVWKKNGNVLGSQAGTTLDLSQPTLGDMMDIIIVTVTPFDGQVMGTPVTASVRILNSQPKNVSLSPATSSALPGVAHVLTSSYTDEDGIAQLNYVNLLGNTKVSQVGGMYLYYNAKQDTLSLGNDEGTGFVTGSGAALGSNVVLENSFVKLDVANTTVDRSNNTLTVNWNIIAKSKFYGAKKLYLRAVDAVGSSSTWQDKGALTILNAAPVNVEVTPATGSSPFGVARVLTTTYSDGNSVDNLSYVNLLANTSASQANGMYLFYNAKLNLLYLGTDGGTRWATGSGITPGTNVVLENSFVKLDVANTTVLRDGDNLTVNWCVIPKSKFAGAKDLYMRAVDISGATTNWEDKGDWSIVNVAPSNVEVTPADSSTLVGDTHSLTTTFSDANGIDHLSYVNLLANTEQNQVTGMYLFYNVAMNKIFLGSDTGNGFVAGSGVTPGTAIVLENSYVKLDVANTTVERNDTSLTINWSVSPKSKLVGTKDLYMRAVDLSGATTNWEDKGNWIITASTGVSGSSTLKAAPSGSAKLF